MYGMSAMSAAMQGLSTTPFFQRLFGLMSNPILGLIIGMALAAIMQSSSASVGVLQALALAGGITYESVIPMVIGINIGQVVPVIIASAGTSKNARRAAIIDLYLNVSGAIVAMPVYMILRATGHLPFLYNMAVPVTIAITHTGYKLLSSLVQLPLYRQFERLGHLTFKDLPSESESLLDRRLMATPSLAMAQCRGVLAGAVVTVNESFDKAASLFTLWNESYTEEIHKT
jgi:phosphate:Na+ symporter